MEKNNAIAAATVESKNNGIRLAVYSDPLGQMEQDGTPYGYSDYLALQMLARAAVVIGFAETNGSYTPCRKPIAVDAEYRSKLLPTTLELADKA